MQQIGRKSERRRSQRSPISKTVTILWDDEGRESRLQGKLLDISVSGARIWLPMKLPARALVSFNCPTMALGGRGSVRYCNSAKGGYEVGLELSNGTGWNDQNKDLENLAAGLEQAEQMARQSTPSEAIPAMAPKPR